MAVQSAEVIGAGAQAVEGQLNATVVSMVAAPWCCTWSLRP